MRLGRRLATGVAEHPPAPQPAPAEQHEPVEAVPVTAAERAPAELAAER